MDNLQKRRTMKATKFQISTWALLLLTIMFACKKVEFDKISSNAWNPSLAVPLAKGEFSVYDILAKADSNDLVVIDQDGSLALVYTSEKTVLNASDIATLPDQNFNYSSTGSGLGIPVVPFFSGTQTVNYSELITMSNPSGAELYEIDFKNGNMNINVSTTLMHDVKYTFTIPDLTENGTVVTRTINLVYSGAIPQTGSATVTLNNGYADLTNGPAGHSELAVNVSVEVTGTGNPIFGTESIDFGVSLQNMQFDLIKAYFGTMNLFSKQDTIDINLFANVTTGNFQLTNPSIDLKFENSFGLPTQINFNTIKTIEGTNDYPLTGFPGTLNLNSPSAPGLSANTTLSLNTTNTGNMNNIFSSTPKKLVYDLNGTANPLGQAVNFVTDTSKLKLIGTLTLPLEGFGTGFMFKDTVAAAANISADFVESALLRLNVDNGFPLEANLKILLVDQNYVVLKDLTNGTQNLIPPAPVNAAGKVISKANKITDFTIVEAEIPLLEQMKYIIFEVDCQTYQGNLGTIVKMYEEYKFNVKIGMMAKAKVQL